MKNTDTILSSTSTTIATDNRYVVGEKGAASSCQLVDTNQSADAAEAAPRIKPKLGTYEIDRTVGKGIFSVVKLATHTITGIQLAVKLIDKTRLDAENRKKIHRETEILKRLHHPNIVKLYQVMETSRLLCIVTEYLPNGEVFDCIATHGRFSEAEARVKFADVLAALDYTHSCGMVHRDLKAENLLFDADMKIKLIDFSFGTRYSESGSHSLLTTWCGSPPYAAPEIFKGEPYVGTKADIWSLGVVLYVLVCGTLPFDAHPLSHLKNQVLSASFRVPYWLSSACERLLRCMLAKVASKRPTTREISHHPWLTQPLPKLATLPPAAVGTKQPAAAAAAAATATAVVPTSSNHQPQSSDGGDVSGAAESTSSDLAADLELGKLNEFVILIMESYGMKRSQIFESLSRRAYDHLMATYLLLGEKIHRHRYSLNCVGSDLRTLCKRTVPTTNHQTPAAVASGEESKKQGLTNYIKPCLVDSAVDMKTCSCETNPVSDPVSVARTGGEDSPCAVAVAADTQHHLPSSSTGDQPIPCSCCWNVQAKDQTKLHLRNPRMEREYNSAEGTDTGSTVWCFDSASHEHFDLTDMDDSCLIGSFEANDTVGLNQADQSTLPWLIGSQVTTDETDDSESIHSHRLLTRLKYGTSNPSASLDQLPLSILAQKQQQSLDRMDCESPDPHNRFSEDTRRTNPRHG